MNWDYVAGFFDGEGTAGVYHDRGRTRQVWTLAWFNTHLPTLEAIQAFMGVGRITLRTSRPIATKPFYQLAITDVANAKMVIAELIPRCITKRDGLVKIEELIRDKRPTQSIESRGVTPEIARRMYCDEGMSLKRMSRETGIEVGCLHRWMVRQGIPMRVRTDRSPSFQSE